jgi:phosphoadenosine phosphosulfate reductase
MRVDTSTSSLFGIAELADLAIARIREFCPPDGYYVAFSGGKDSVVLLDLIRRAGVPHDCHYHLTTVDPPRAGALHQG